MTSRLGICALALLGLLAGCGPLGVVGDAAVGAAQVAVGTVDLVL